MATSQDGPLLVGAVDQNTPGKVVPLLRNSAGELIVTSGGASGSTVDLISVGGSPIALGQDNMAGSIPVVIASDQSAIDVNVLSGGGSNASVSATGAAVPASATFVGFRDAGGNLEPVILEADGSLPVTVLAGGGANASVAATGAAVPASATYIGINVGGNLTAPVAGSGTAAAAMRVELPTNGTGTLATVAAVTAITNPVTVVQPTGTSLHAVIDTGSTTAVTQGTATNLKAEVIGAGTAGTANAGVLTVQGIAAMTPLLVTPAANSAVNVAQLAGTATSVNSGNKDAGTLRVTLATDQVQLTNPLLITGTGTAGTAATGVQTIQGIASMTPVQVSQATAANLNVTVATKTIYQKQLAGTAITVISTAVDVAAAAFSVTTTTFTNNDAACPGAPYAYAVGSFPDWAAAPVAGTVVSLWGLLKDVDGTNDDTDPPSGSASGGARYFGSWVIAAADALQRRTITISLLGITEAMSVDFYFKNETAQNMNNDAGTSAIVKITPFTMAQVG